MWPSTCISIEKKKNKKKTRQKEAMKGIENNIKKISWNEEWTKLI